MMVNAKLKLNSALQNSKLIKSLKKFFCRKFACFHCCAHQYGAYILPGYIEATAQRFSSCYDRRTFQ